MRTGGVEDIAQLAGRNHRTGFLHERVVAVVEINRVHHAGFLGQLDQLGRFFGRHREWFSEMTCLPAAMIFLLISKCTWLGVQLMWTLVLQQRFPTAVGLRDAERRALVRASSSFASQSAIISTKPTRRAAST